MESSPVQIRAVALFYYILFLKILIFVSFLFYRVVRKKAESKEIHMLLSR